MAERFKDRKEAGRRLAELLEDYAGREDVVVLGLPRGGVPVAREIAERLEAPLDVYIVRKLGTPGQEELAMGAIASNGARIINEHVVRSVGIPRSEIDQVARREREEIRRREKIYRGARKSAELAGKVVILVDDGLATGASMKVAVQAVRESSPKRIVVAVGTTPPQTLEEFKQWDEVDDVVAALTPAMFLGVAGSYEDFSQTSDKEVSQCLDAAANRGGER
ncbi:MAG: phosphoribosyltransferase [Verrucomicrobiota bacterium]